MTHIEIINRFADFDTVVYPLRLMSIENAPRIVVRLGYSMNKADQRLC